MALACEGVPYFAGGPSRQLGSRRQPKGAFPFVTTAMPPKAEDEVGSIEAEVWVPIWDRPMTEPELRLLLVRGRAELGGKGATSSAAFAAGIVSRGVDAGVAEFRRFLLLHTTSAQTFESRLATIVPVPKRNLDSAASRATRTIVAFRDALPEDRKVGQRWRFSGLRGPLEQALVDFAAAEPGGGGGGRVERAWALVDEVTEALVKVGRNRGFRSQRVRFQSLPVEWAAALFAEDPPDREWPCGAGDLLAGGNTGLPAAHRVPLRGGEADGQITLGVLRVRARPRRLERCRVDGESVCGRRPACCGGTGTRELAAAVRGGGRGGPGRCACLVVGRCRRGSTGPVAGPALRLRLGRQGES